MISFEELFQKLEPIMDSLIDRDLQLFRKNHPKSYGKYIVKWQFHLRRALKRYAEVGLLDSDPKTILDISTGTGLFPFVCSENGHTVKCTENKGSGFELKYKNIHERLNLDCQYFKINVCEEVPVEGSFDVITSFDICWDKIKNKSKNLRERWLPFQYQYLLDDLLLHLNPRGTIWLKPFEYKNLLLAKNSFQKEIREKIQII